MFLPPGRTRPTPIQRPIAGNSLTNGLIGCFRGRALILATASDHTHELFEGVYVCSATAIPRSPGAPEETSGSDRRFISDQRRSLRCQRYQQDFPRARTENSEVRPTQATLRPRRSTDGRPPIWNGRSIGWLPW